MRISRRSGSAENCIETDKQQTVLIIVLVVIINISIHRKRILHPSAKRNSVQKLGLGTPK